MSRDYKTSAQIRAQVTGLTGKTAYIKLPGHPDEIVPGSVSKTIILDDLLNYTGPRVHLDLDKDNRLIGLEILVLGSSELPTTDDDAKQ